MSDWLPIESAPDDGPYLVFGSITGSLFGGEGEPDPPGVHWCEGGAFRDADGKLGRFMTNDCCEDYAYGYATHWVALPNPPQP